MAPCRSAHLYPIPEVWHVIDRKQCVWRTAGQRRDTVEGVVWCEEKQPAVVATSQREVPVGLDGDYIVFIRVDENLETVDAPQRLVIGECGRVQ
jgi:hypothetical protein